MCALVGGSRSQLLLTAHYHATVGRHLITTGLHFTLNCFCQDASETFAEDSPEFRTQVKCVLVNGRVWRSAKENDVKCNHLFPWKCSFCQASHWTDMVVFPQSQEILVQRQDGMKSRRKVLFKISHVVRQGFLRSTKLNVHISGAFLCSNFPL